MGRAYIGGMTNETMTPRFAETHCSQCGKGLGPGDHGVSHCEHHGANEPQSCYPAEINTLVDMLDEQHDRLATLKECNPTSGVRYSLGQTKKRIEALTTAIEALGGAL
jgi:hypothetical protein